MAGLVPGIGERAGTHNIKIILSKSVFKSFLKVGHQKVCLSSLERKSHNLGFHHRERHLTCAHLTSGIQVVHREKILIRPEKLGSFRQGQVVLQIIWSQTI